MNGALWLLPLFAVGYALWAFFRLRRMERNEPADGIVSEDTPCRQEIIGRSRFVLDPRHSRPQAAVESETEKVTEKADIFVPANGYDGARYTIRYFQPDGRGELRMDDGTVFLPNDRYPLDREVFRLYYTSRSDDQQTIDVYVEDNTGQVVKTSFTFQSENGTEETER